MNVDTVRPKCRNRKDTAEESEWRLTNSRKRKFRELMGTEVMVKNPDCKDANLYNPSCPSLQNLELTCSHMFGSSSLLTLTALAVARDPQSPWEKRPCHHKVLNLPAVG